MSFQGFSMKKQSSSSKPKVKPPPAFNDSKDDEKRDKRGDDSSRSNGDGAKKESSGNASTANGSDTFTGAGETRKRPPVDYKFGGKYKRMKLDPTGSVKSLRSVDSYERLEQIGKGAFSVIFKAKDKETGEILAIKAMRPELKKQQEGVTEGISLEMVREMRILQSIRHPNIVKIKEIVLGSDSDSYFMAMEIVDYDLGLLIEHMKEPFSEGQIKCLSMQLLSALNCLHANWIMHRDLKQTNLLLDKHGVLKLCDFGLARQFTSPSKKYTPDVVSHWYRSPELILGMQEYGTAVDMWSFGCIFVEWIQRNALFPGTGELDQLTRIFKLLGTPTELSWPAFQKLAEAKGFRFPENVVVNMSRSGELIKIPNNVLRKRIPKEGYNPMSMVALNDPTKMKTTALSDKGFEMLSTCLICDPDKRVSAATAVEHPWFNEGPLPTPLSRREIRQLKREREEAMANPLTHLHLRAQQAQAAASATAAAIAAKMNLPTWTFP